MMQSQEVWAGQPMKPTACSVVKRPQLTKVRGVHGVECSEVQRSFWTLGRLRQHPRKGARPQSPGVHSSPSLCLLSAHKEAGN